jgi:hypothetical protein
MAAETDADVIVMAGVHLMAETAKLLNPSKTALIPDLRAGCSLAESITAADVRLLRQRYPGVPVVTYVNISAEVKAEIGHLLHIIECGQSRRIPRQPASDIPARPESGTLGRLADRRGGDPVAWCTSVSPACSRSPAAACRALGRRRAGRTNSCASRLSRPSRSTRLPLAGMLPYCRSETTEGSLAGHRVA